MAFSPGLSSNMSNVLHKKSMRIIALLMVVVPFTILLFYWCHSNNSLGKILISSYNFLGKKHTPFSHLQLYIPMRFWRFSIWEGMFSITCHDITTTLNSQYGNPNCLLCTYDSQLVHLPCVDMGLQTATNPQVLLRVRYKDSFCRLNILRHDCMFFCLIRFERINVLAVFSCTILLLLFGLYLVKNR